MLRTSAIATVLPVSSIDASKDFYENKLGFKSLGKMPSGEYLLACGNGAEIALRECDLKPTGKTEVSFEVKDIVKEVNGLEGSGVHFEDYEDPEYKTDQNHVCTKGDMKAAWFKDPSGNVLCLHEYKQPS
jgi:catechol 2,3-dioxygenase-like lactoylglutathione lyase family enzyme